MKVFKVITYVMAPDPRTAYVLRELSDAKSVVVEEATEADPKHRGVRIANKDMSVGEALIDLARSSC
jgi:hypothetical protein